ncbi:MAG: cheW-like domain protein [Chthoniobacteraceae bacterium]|nr:cheW-like domain protein [Chthoniobacteraceae bacterium]
MNDRDNSTSLRGEAPAPSATLGFRLNDCWNKIGVRGDQSCPELAAHVHCRNCPVYSKAATELLDGELRAEQRADWTRHFAREKEVSEPGLHSLLIFRVGTEWLALPTVLFKEVADLRPIHTLPHRRNNVVLGLVNVRGELTVCVSLSHVLGMDAGDELGAGKNPARGKRLVVLQREGNRVVFPVDEVFGTHRFSSSDIKALPSTVAKATATYTHAVGIWREKSVGLLDAELLFYTLNRSLS